VFVVLKKFEVKKIVNLNIIFLLFFVSKALSVVVLEDTFENSQLSSNWQLSFDNATSWEYEISDSNLIAKKIAPIIINQGDDGTWSNANLSQLIPHLNNFDIHFNLSWDSENKNEPMNQLLVALYDKNNQIIAKVGYTDYWVAHRGFKYLQVGSSGGSNGYDKLPHKGSLNFQISRNNGNINIFCNEQDVYSGYNHEYLCKISVIFSFYPYKKYNVEEILGNLYADSIKVEGTSIDFPNTCFEAFPLEFNKTINTKIDYPGQNGDDGDCDYFKIDIDEKTEVSIFTTGNTDTYAVLFDCCNDTPSNCPLRIDNNNSGDGANFRIDRLLNEGTYYLKVRHNDKLSGIGDYSLHLSVLDWPEKTVIVTYPDIFTSSFFIRENEELNINGSGFTPEGNVNLIIYSSEDDEDALQFEIIADSKGNFVYKYNSSSKLINKSVDKQSKYMFVPYYCRAVDNTTDLYSKTKKFIVQSLNQFDQFEFLQPPKEGSDIDFFSKENIHVVWSDFLYTDSIYEDHPIQKTKRKYKYIIYFTFDGGNSWQNIGTVEGYGLKNETIQESYDFKYPEYSDKCQIQIVDADNISRVFKSVVFKNSKISSQSLSVEKLWDYSFPRTDVLPKGVAADGVSRIYLKLSINNIFSPITKIKAYLSDEFNNTPQSLGKLMKANFLDTYNEEANQANSIEIDHFTDNNSVENADTNYYFWYISPDDFVGNNPDDINSANRTVNVTFSITFSNEENINITDAIEVVRPPLMFVHGLAGDKYETWKGLKFNNDIVFKDPRFWVKCSVKIGPHDSFIGNAMKLFHQQHIHNNRSSFYYVCNKIRKLGYASNQVDYICHSMGGSVLRTAFTNFKERFYANSSQYEPCRNYSKGFVHKFISLDTPHLGSPWADIINTLVYRINTDKYLKEYVSMKFYKDINADFLSHLLSPASFKKHCPLPIIWPLTKCPVPVYKTDMFKITDAVRDLSFKNTIVYDAVEKSVMPSHLIAGDICKTNDIKACLDNLIFYDNDKYKKYFSFIDYMIDTHVLTKKKNSPDFNKLMEIKRCTNKYERVIKYIDYLVNSKYQVNDFIIDSDLIVPVNSQLSGLSIDSKNVSVFYGTSHAVIKSIASNDKVGNKINMLLNSPISSDLFGSIPAKLSKNSFRTTFFAHEKNQEVINRSDAEEILIISPNNNSSFIVDETINLKFIINDINNLIYVTIFFQDESYSDFSKESHYNFNFKVSGEYLGYQVLEIRAIYVNDDNSEILNKNIIVNVKPTSLPVRFSASPFILETKVGQKVYPKFETIYSNFVSKEIPNKVSAHISDNSIVTFNEEMKYFRGLNPGETKIILSHENLLYTMFIVVNECIYGDLDNNWEVDLKDLIVVLQLNSGYSLVDFILSDMNGNQKIDNAEAIYILNKILEEYN